jgi:hypothetical protein
MPLFAPVTTTTFPIDEAADDAIVSFAKKNSGDVEFAKLSEISLNRIFTQWRMLEG